MALEFEPISLARQDEYHKALFSCPDRTTSDYAFANIWGWAEHYGMEWAFYKDLVFLRQTKPETVCWAPVGPWENYDWANCKAMMEAGRFTRVPEHLAGLWGKAYGDDIELTENRGHFDYVYGVEDLTELRGNKFHKKKNLLNQFLKKYDFDYHPMEPDCVEEVLAMQADWIAWYEENNPSEALVSENRAIERVLHDFDRIGGLMGGAIRVDGHVIAYTVAEALDEETLVIHFEKGNIRFKGIYQAINQMFLKHQAQDFRYVNREQDLGDEGLRKAKLSYNPEFLHKKYEAVLK